VRTRGQRPVLPSSWTWSYRLLDDRERRVFGALSAVRDAAAGWPPSRALTAALAGRASALRILGRAAEAASDARRSLALARQIGDPAGELSFQAYYVGHHDEAVRLAWQTGQIIAGIPGATARYCSYVLTIVLAGAGQLA
jgi:hypothetical protein